MSPWHLHYSRVSIRLQKPQVNAFTGDATDRYASGAGTT